MYQGSDNCLNNMHILRVKWKRKDTIASSSRNLCTMHVCTKRYDKFCVIAVNWYTNALHTSCIYCIGVKGGRLKAKNFLDGLKARGSAGSHRDLALSRTFRFKESRIAPLRFSSSSSEVTISNFPRSWLTCTRSSLEYDTTKCTIHEILI